MVSIRFSIVTTLLALLSGIYGALAAPVHQFDGEARATPADPHWVIYTNKWTGGSSPPDPSALKGYNVVALSFLLINGAWDAAGSWATLTPEERATIKRRYATAGIKLIVSAFGSTDTPTSSGTDPVAVATTMGNWVKTNDLDGIDLDYEDFAAMEAGTAEAWLISFTQHLRAILPQSDGYIVTHAPIAPWFSPGKFKNGAYLTIDQKVGSLIDWYNIQFYNQGPAEYTTCDNLFHASSPAWPKSSVFEIAASGIPLNKIVIGKPANTAGAFSGYLDSNSLATCVSEAKKSGWNGGTMVWQYPDATSAWISTVRGQSWPL